MMPTQPAWSRCSILEGVTSILYIARLYLFSSPLQFPNENTIYESTLTTFPKESSYFYRYLVHKP